MTSAKLAILLVAVAGLSGCSRTAPVRDVRHRPAVLQTGMNASHATTHAAIVKALSERGYAIDSDDGHVVMARVGRGDLWARMRIEAGDGRYSITHADSSEAFRYDPDRGTVHRRYNSWVRNLTRTIDATLSETVEEPAVAAPAVAAKAEAPKPAPAAPRAEQEQRAEQAEPAPLPDRSTLPDRREPVRPPGAIDI